VEVDSVVGIEVEVDVASVVELGSAVELVLVEADAVDSTGVDSVVAGDSSSPQPAAASAAITSAVTTVPFEPMEVTRAPPLTRRMRRS